MKKRVIFILALAFLLMACSQPAELSREEIIEKLEEANEDIESMYMEMEIEQIMGEEDDEDFYMKIKSDIEMEIIVEPLKGYLVISTNEENQNIKMEMYMDEENMYMKDPLSGGKWTKMPLDFLGEDIFEQTGMDNPQMNDELIKELEALGDELKVSTKGNEYILEFEGEGEKAEALLKAQIESEMGDLGFDIGYEVNFIKMKYSIDKDTFRPTTLEMEMDYSMDLFGDSMPIYQKIIANTSRVNEIKEIIIPEEALNAEAMEDIFLEED